MDRTLPTAPHAHNARTACQGVNVLSAHSLIVEHCLSRWRTVLVGGTQVMDYFYVSAQLSACNSAMQEMHNMINWWDSLSLIQKKTRATKLKICTTVETQVLSIISARTAESPALPGQAGITNGLRVEWY